MKCRRCGQAMEPDKKPDVFYCNNRKCVNRWYAFKRPTARNPNLLEN